MTTGILPAKMKKDIYANHEYLTELMNNNTMADFNYSNSSVANVLYNATFPPVKACITYF